jgi:hypothetical protein
MEFLQHIYPSYFHDQFSRTHPRSHSDYVNFYRSLVHWGPDLWDFSLPDDIDVS